MLQLLWSLELFAENMKCGFTNVFSDRKRRLRIIVKAHGSHIEQTIKIYKRELTKYISLVALAKIGSAPLNLYITLDTYYTVCLPKLW